MIYITPSPNGSIILSLNDMLYRNKYRIESSRCPKWNYSSPGYYFITVVTHNRDHLFGEVIDGKMRLNEYGKIVNKEWRITGEKHDTIVLDEFQVMPNHMHGIIRLSDTGCRGCDVQRARHNNGDDLNNGNDGGDFRDRRFRCRDVACYVSTNGTNDTNRINHLNGTFDTGDAPKEVFANDIIGPATGKSVRITLSEISPVSGSLSTIVRSFKSAITRRINEFQRTPGAPVLQSRFHDHIIRDEKELFLIRRYIRNNPANWVVGDEFNDGIENPARLKSP